jgi:pimeloyl-ACP methyl ester carboxylesterase
VPTLLVQGADDDMMPAALARSYVARHPSAEMAELDGTHFVMLERAAAFRATLTRFLIARRDEVERRAAGATR